MDGWMDISKIVYDPGCHLGRQQKHQSFTRIRYSINSLKCQPKSGYQVMDLWNRVLNSVGNNKKPFSSFGTFPKVPKDNIIFSSWSLKLLLMGSFSAFFWAALQTQDTQDKIRFRGTAWHRSQKYGFQFFVGNILQWRCCLWHHICSALDIKECDMYRNHNF